MKHYFKFLCLAAVVGLFIVSCSGSDDSSDDQVSTPEGGVVKLVITLDELITDSKMGVNLIPIAEFDEGVTSATYINTGQSNEAALGISDSDFDYTSTVHTFVTSDEVHTLQTQLFLPNSIEGEENAYTVEIFFNDVLAHSDKSIIGLDTVDTRTFKWSSDEGFEDNNIDSNL